MARVRDVTLDEVPDDLRALYARFSGELGACAVEVLMLGDWRATAGEVGSWPEYRHLAGPTLGWKSHTGRPERKRFVALDGRCAPRSQCVGGPERASACAA